MPSVPRRQGRQWPRPKAAILACFLFFIGIHGARAATFNVLPSIVYITPGKPIVELKLTNEGNENITFQAKLYSWAQDAEGAARYEPSNFVVFFPRIFTLHPHRSQIIRIGIQNPKELSTEKTYRIFIRQLPSKVGAIPGAVQMVVNISVPIFVLPPTQAVSGKIEHIDLDKGGLFFAVSNPGNVHFMEHLVDVVGFDKKNRVTFQRKIPGWYVLPGEKRNYQVKIPQSDCEKSKKISLIVVAESPLLRRGADMPDSKYTTFSKNIPVTDDTCGSGQ